ncbi:MAG: amidohydrolase family protein, partial [Gemmatimonadota bacterium]
MNGVPSGPIDLIVANASEVLTCVGTAAGEIGRIAGGAVAVGGGRVIAVGPEAEIRSALDTSAARVIDAHGCAVVPGFVDSHIHLVLGGSRVR